MVSGQCLDDAGLLSGDCLDGAQKLSGQCLDNIKMAVWMVSGQCLDVDVLLSGVSGWCLEAVWIVSKQYTDDWLNGVWTMLD